MSWRTDNFRNPAHKQRALELRNQGITVSPHASWGEAWKAKQQATRAALAELDNFDLYVLAAIERERGSRQDFESDYHIGTLRYQERMEDEQELPF